MRDSIYASESYNEHKWNFIERQVILWSGQTGYYICLLLVAVGALITSLHALKPSIAVLLGGDLDNWNWLLDWQTSILSAQLTMIGVIFPLVIGLVGFLLQDKTASKAIWSVYNRYSGFLFTGFSGLLLAIFIIVGGYFDSFISGYGYLFHCLLSTGWLILNILLTGWFLFSTFKVIQERSRDELLLRYTINESCIDSIRVKLSLLIPQNAVHSGLVALPEGIETRVTTFRFSRENEAVYARHFKKPVYIRNIYFRLLSLAVYVLSKKSDFANLSEESRLVVPSSVDNTARKEVVLATSNGFELNKLEKLLFRFSYSLSRRRPFDVDTLDDIIYSLVGSAADELKNRNPKLFEDAIERLAQWHCALSDSLTFSNDSKQLDNWLLLPSTGFSQKTYLDSLLGEYYLLTKQAISVLPESTEYFHELAYLHLKIYNWNKEKLPNRMVKEVIRGHYLSWAALVQWSAMAEKTPDSHIYNQYENALLAYIGAWESWPMYLEPRTDRWKESIDSVNIFTEHLRYTAQQVVVAIRHDDALSAEWAADMLLHWFSNISLRENHNGRYFWYHELITPITIEKEIADGIWHFILNGNEYDERAAVQIAMENAWLDMRIVCACYIASKPTQQGSDFSFRVAEALLKGTRFKPTGGVDISTNSIESGADILYAFLRQRGYWEDREGSYGNWLDTVVDTFNRINEPKRVSGRIYSGWGISDVRSLTQQFVRFAILLSDRPWVLSQRWIDILFSDAVEHERRNSLVSDLEGWLKIADENIIVEADITEEKIGFFKSSLEEAIGLIRNRVLVDVRNAEIDIDRLIQFGKAASKSGFSIESGSFLLRFFEGINFVNEPISECEKVLKIKGYSKSDVAKNIEVNRAVNEEEWLDDAIRQSISSHIFHSLCRLDCATESSFENVQDFLLRVSADIREKGKDDHDLVLFIAPWSIHQYLNNIAYGLEESEALNVEQRNGYSGPYICHLEGCPVYDLSYRGEKFSLLVPESIFKTLCFTRFDEDRYVNVTPIDEDEESLKLTLALTYFMQIEYGDEQIQKYVLLQKETD